MSVMPNAFDELVTITRSNVPTPQFDAVASKTVDSARGLYPVLVASPYGYPPGQLALVTPNSVVTYTVRVTNTGDAAGVIGIDDYWGDANFIFQQFVVAPTHYAPYLSAGWRGLYVTDTLQPGQATEFKYTLVMSTGIGLGFYYSNYVDLYDDTTSAGFPTIQGAWAGAIYRDFSTSATTGFPAFTSKSAPASALPGQTITYTLHMKNPSSVDQPIKITDTLPSGVTYVSDDFGGTYNAGSHTVYVSTTVPGTSRYFTDLHVVAQIPATATVGTMYQNTARFYHGLTNALITTKSASTSVEPSAELDLTKSSSKLIGHVGDTLKYQVVFKNMGPLMAGHAMFVDRVPMYLDVITSTIRPAAVSYMPGTHTLEWTGDIAVGQMITVTYDAKVNSTAHSSLALINLASIDADNGTGTAYGSAKTEVVDFFRIFLPVIRR
jgi:uncharacterized repeat protein (TIGR01451 family)